MQQFHSWVYILRNGFSFMIRMSHTIFWDIQVFIPKWFIAYLKCKFYSLSYILSASYNISKEKKKDDNFKKGTREHIEEIQSNRTGWTSWAVKYWRLTRYKEFWVIPRFLAQGTYLGIEWNFWCGGRI